MFEKLLENPGFWFLKGPNNDVVLSSRIRLARNIKTLSFPNIIDESDAEFWLFIGNYFTEVTENLKDQIAVNAVRMKFQGDCVAVLNFNAPALSKKVALQMITNFQRRGQPVDYAVTWGYEYKSNAYRIGINRQKWKSGKNLGEIARRLGRKGGHPRGGGGHEVDGNFYWPRTAKQDIWDLFEGKC